jgi:choline dehydrogenase-like flavoprotein
VSALAADILVIGSGAGGATTALTLAERGCRVLVLEEGARVPSSAFGGTSPEAMQRLYRRRGMTPIMGRVPIGYVEGCCLGGSTEINSGFWHRTPAETLLRWRTQYDLASAAPADLQPHFEWAEALLGVGGHSGPWPASTTVFVRGAERMGWSVEETPRAARACRNSNACASGCPTGAKPGMSRSLLPAAEAAGARVLTGCRVRRLLEHRRTVTGVVAELQRPDGTAAVVRIDAQHVVVCGGATETPALLRRSGIRWHVGDSLRIHPMLKVVARFPEVIDAHRSVLPLAQVSEFGPEITLGGAFFTAGHLALVLSENWNRNAQAMARWRQMATYYVAVRGNGRGRVRSSAWGGQTLITHELRDEDIANLSRGLARLSMLLLAAGADELYPAVFGLPAIRTERDAVKWLDQGLRPETLALSTVHAFASCPMGERRDRCAADSFGAVHGFDNLYINDASMLPDSPGVNPQGTIMALARRNALALQGRLA